MNDQNSSTLPQKKDFKKYITEENGLPDKLISLKPIYIHYSSGTRSSDYFSLRVYPNGELWRYSNTRKIIENYIPKRLPAEYAWRYEATITAEGIETLQALLATDFKMLESPDDWTGTEEMGKHFRCAIYDQGFKEIVLPEGPLTDEYKVIQNVENSIYHNIIPQEE